MLIPYSNVIAIHRALHAPRVQRVTIDNHVVRIDRLDSPRRLFAICSLGESTFVTQNLRKPSNWTSWVKMDESRQLTWITRRHGRGYTGRVEREVREETERIKVILFAPTEHVVYTEEKPVER